MKGRDLRRRPARGGVQFSGWTGLAVGLALGLAVAAAVWLRDGRPAAEPVAAAPPAPMSARQEAGEDPAAEPATEFTFYDKLRNFEVVIPERDKDVRRDLAPAPETRPGSYVLQAGSYRNFADADRVRAQLALQGIESKVQKVTIDADTWHRVRVGPIADLEQLNRVRTRLRQSDIDALVIRVGD